MLIRACTCILTEYLQKILLLVARAYITAYETWIDQVKPRSVTEYLQKILLLVARAYITAYETWIDQVKPQSVSFRDLYFTDVISCRLFNINKYHTWNNSTL